MKFECFSRLAGTCWRSIFARDSSEAYTSIGWYEAEDVAAAVRFANAELLQFWGGYRLGFNASEHHPESYAASVRCPALFIHGSADQRAKIDEVRQAAQEAGVLSPSLELLGVSSSLCSTFP